MQGMGEAGDRSAPQERHGTAEYEVPSSAARRASAKARSWTAKAQGRVRTGERYNRN